MGYDIFNARDNRVRGFVVLPTQIRHNHVPVSPKSYSLFSGSYPEGRGGCKIIGIDCQSSWKVCPKNDQRVRYCIDLGIHPGG